jgi:hypothetical protein
VAVVGVMSISEPCLCQWPTKRALAVAEETAEPLGLEEFPGLELAVLFAGGAAVLERALVVAEVPVPDVLFEHPAAPAVTITVAAMATTNPGFTSKVFAVIWLSLSIGGDRAATPETPRPLTAAAARASSAALTFTTHRVRLTAETRPHSTLLWSPAWPPGLRANSTRWPKPSANWTSS